ncbi:ABC transporter permease [Candidatus Micrarchaeota archaeon]|nr:ABC transporter permease [Candidatus Micrarchaeota archaeon]
MKIRDIVDLALTSIRHRHLRSWLTILGIVIGVASIIILIGLSLGISQQINQRINTLGSNIIIVTPGGGQAQRFGGFGGGGAGGGNGGLGGGFGGRGDSAHLTFREADDLRQLPGVLKVDARLQERAVISYRDRNISLSVVGTEPLSFKDSVSTDILYGRYLSTSDQRSAVLGYSIVNSTFKDFDILNKQIKINGIPFRVVGILKESGGLTGTDSAIFIPQQAAKNLFNQTVDASQFVIVAGQGQDNTIVANSIQAALLNLHRVSLENQDFQVITAASIQSAVSGITDILSLFLGGIASISLIVGGIGVANTMFMSVLEQTKEIGVLKALGAKNRDIVYLFLTEAGTIGLVGGILGLALSFVVAFLLGLAGLAIIIPAELIALGLLFSAVIGILAGISPANNAAKIPPVEALKYE